MCASRLDWHAVAASLVVAQAASPVAALAASPAAISRVASQAAFLAPTQAPTQAARLPLAPMTAQMALPATSLAVFLAAPLVATKAAPRSFGSPVRRYRLITGGPFHRWITSSAHFRANDCRTSVAS